jgi:signal transduction histidine kinase
VLLALVFTCFLGIGSAGRADEKVVEPGKIVTEYALTSAYNYEYNDPSNWWLLASKNGGATWDTLDVHTNQFFKTRSERRFFAITNRTAYSLYRLRVEPGQDVQLAEVELLGPEVAVPAARELKRIITSSREQQLWGPATDAFDGDPTTRWVDFGLGGFCWIQCQYSLEATNLVTSVSQYLLQARRLATRNPLHVKASQVLSNLATQATTPVRTLSGYALTSANDAPERDPRDWRLLGSNDGGKTWELLDMRCNESFATRLHRRVFSLGRPATYAIYRLAIDSVRAPLSASSIQLAEIEPIYTEKETKGRYSIVVSARGENPPMEVADAAFDRDTKSKWLDFAEASGQSNTGGNTKRSSWIQWQYLADLGVPVVNLHWLKSVRARRDEPLFLRLEGIVVFSSTEMQTVGLLDQTGFQPFQLPGFNGQIHLGERVSLAGRLQFGQDLPSVVDADLICLGRIDSAPEIKAGERFGNAQQPLLSSVEGEVTSVSLGSGSVDIHLKGKAGASDTVAKLINLGNAAIPALVGCRLRAEGIVQPVFSHKGEVVAGIIWVPDWDHVSLANLRADEWERWPKIGLTNLPNAKAEPALGGLVRATGLLVKADADQLALTDGGTNRLIVAAKQIDHRLSGSTVEAIGFLEEKGGKRVLNMAQLRVPQPAPPKQPEHASTNEEFQGPAKDIRQLYEWARSRPGKRFPATLRGVITYVDLELDGFYLQDGTGGIQVGGGPSSGISPFLQQEGSYVEVTGEYSPSDREVLPSSFANILGRGQMPEPRRHSLGYLMTGMDFNKWVEVEGIVAEVADHRLGLRVTGGKLTIWINDMTSGARGSLLGSTVRICGVCAPVVNSRNATVGVRLLTPSMEQVQVIKAFPQDPFAMTSRPLGDVTSLGTEDATQGLEMIKTEGIVTYNDTHTLFVQDGVNGLRVLPRGAVEAKPGDRVEVVGFAESDGFSSKLVQALVRKTGSSALPPANIIDLLETDLSGQDAIRGQIEAVVLGSSFEESLQKIQLQDEKRMRVFSAFFTTNQGLLAPIPAGCRVSLKGVFKAETDALPDFGQVINSFAMYANGPADLAVLERPSWWSAGHSLWVLGGLGAVLFLSLAWVGSLGRRVQRRTQELNEKIEEHKRTEAQLQGEIAERKRIEAKVTEAHKELLAASRLAGMAEVATSVLHNVGNVLNSVNISASLVSDHLRNSKSSNVARVANLMNEHAADLGDFLTHDPKGRQLPSYLNQLAGLLATEQSSISDEIQSLQKNIEHIKEIVSMQQTYARVTGVTETIQVTELVEDALRMNAGALTRHDVQIIRNYDPLVPEITVEKHKVLQILVNLIRNAKYACDESTHQKKWLTVSVTNGDDRVRVAVIDNGVGIPAENLTRIFEHGFTTRKDGHGFALHSGALAARELGGSLHVHSDGPGTGAAFTLELPCPHNGMMNGLTAGHTKISN